MMISTVQPSEQYQASQESNRALGESDFMTILITQLQNQDPLSPMEGTEFATQLAQFSALDEAKKTTSGIKEMQNFLNSLNNFSSLSLLGREIEFDGNTLFHEEGMPTEISFNLPTTADVSLRIYDEAGNMVSSRLQGLAMQPGRNTLVWDGQDDTGLMVPTGNYRYELDALDSADNGPVTARLIQRGMVEEVAFQDGVSMLRVGQRWVPLSDIQSIYSALEP